MHFYALIAVPPGVDDIDEAIAQLMAPFCEEDNDGNYSDDGWWDWYQIGGRWTGKLDGYQPELDPNNIETCIICHGSGMRSDVLGLQARAVNPEYTCNGCGGKGAAVKWPSQFEKHAGDIARFGDVKAGLIESPPFRLLFGEEMACKETYVPGVGDDYGHFDQHPERVAELLARIPDDTVVAVVDYHS